MNNTQCTETALDYLNNYYNTNDYLQLKLDTFNSAQHYLGEEFIKNYEKNLMNSTYAEIVTQKGKIKTVGIYKAKEIREGFKNTAIPEVKNNVRALDIVVMRY